jgi:hypothetical protein
MVRERERNGLEAAGSIGSSSNMSGTVRRGCAVRNITRK